MPAILRTREGAQFLVIVCIVFCVALSLISLVTFKGVESQYSLPMEEWSTSLLLIQGAWVAIYSIMFTIIGSLPFGFYLLSPRSEG